MTENRNAVTEKGPIDAPENGEWLALLHKIKAAPAGVPMSLTPTDILGLIERESARQRAVALREAASGMSNDIWEGRGPNLHLDHYPMCDSIRAWLNGRADRETDRPSRPGEQ